MLTWNTILETATKGNPPPARRVERTDAECRAQLTPEQYHVTRQHGTERAFSSEMCSLFEPGRYACLCCGTVLFDASEKFESGTGRPSFTQPIAPRVIAYHVDRSYGMVRVETTCNTCDAHLGHVFPDGPAPSGLRYCMNKEVFMEMDIPLTDMFWCPSCGFRGLFKAEPTAYVKCICGRWWVIGDYKYYMSLTREEREKIKTWDVNLYKDHKEVNHSRFDRADIYS